jgi:hypothetical protein
MLAWSALTDASPLLSNSPAFAPRAKHSLRAPGTRHGEPATGPFRQACAAASAPPRAADIALAVAPAPSRLLSTPGWLVAVFVAKIMPSVARPRSESCRPSLRGGTIGLIHAVSSSKPPSGAARPLGGASAAETSIESGAAAPHSAFTVAATSARGREAAATVGRASCGVPPSPSQALAACCCMPPALASL